MAAYEPVNVSMGALPEFSDEWKSYDIKMKGKLPADAKEVLLYTFVTTRGEGDFQRGYYEISTSQGEKNFTQYMNVATGQGVLAVNSANMWFPVGEGKLNIKLVHSDDKESIAGKTGQDKDWSEVFVIGYRK